VAQSLARTGSGLYKGSFQTADGLFKVNVAHSLGSKFNQRVFRLDRTQTVADVLTTGNSFNITDSVWVVSKTPVVGLTAAQQKQLPDGLLAYLTASSGAAITKLLGGES